MDVPCISVTGFCMIPAICMQLSEFNFTSVTCEKSASSLTQPNTTDVFGSLGNPMPVVTSTKGEQLIL
jgi:hypothetical protein